jgi:hypothetical protein
MSSAEQVIELNRKTKRDAKKLARYLGETVGIGFDDSLTVGNVTFDKSRRYLMTVSDMIPVVDFFSDANCRAEGEEPGHVLLTRAPVSEDGWEGWREQSQRPIGRPTEFAATVDPPGRVVKLAYRVLFGE